MDERTVQFRVGVMVLATLLITGILALMFGKMPSLAGRGYTIYVTFSQAPGVTKGTPIRKSGILVGRVSNVDFADDSGVVLTLEINRGVRLFHNEVCQVRGSLLGDAVLQFALSTDKKAKKTPIEPGETVKGAETNDPMQLMGNLEGDLTGAIRSIGKTSDDLGRLARTANKMLEGNDDQITRIVNGMETTLNSLQSLTKVIDEALSDKPDPKNPDAPTNRQRMTKALQELPDRLDEMRASMASVNKNLKNMENFTEPLGKRGPAMVEKIDSGLTRLDAVLTQLDQFTQAMNKPNSSLGQLMNNPDLYQNLNTAVSNVEQLTRELRPVIRDARVFADKIARHPEVLGVRGAIRPSAGTKGPIPPPSNSGTWRLGNP
jgi:phospholipid/cholesterol/gamma-HCH transport system substrate-binding protein